MTPINNSNFGVEPCPGSMVSILIAAYNAEHTIAETLRSAIAQTWRPLEIIVIDDGSNDKTGDVVRSFDSQLPDGVVLRMTRQQNAGMSAALNVAYQNCSGDYIQYLDADDLLSPDKVARQMEVALQIADPFIPTACGFGRFHFRSRETKFIRSALWETLSPVEWLTRKLEHNIYLQTSCWLTHRRLVDAVGPWSESLTNDQDGEFFLRVVKRSKRIEWVPINGVYYRRSGVGALSHVGKSVKKADGLMVSKADHCKVLLALEDSPRTRAACVKQLQDCLPTFKPSADASARAYHLATELGGSLKPLTPRPYWGVRACVDRGIDWALWRIGL